MTGSGDTKVLSLQYQGLWQQTTKGVHELFSIKRKKQMGQAQQKLSSTRQGRPHQHIWLMEDSKERLVYSVYHQAHKENVTILNACSTSKKDCSKPNEQLLWRRFW